MQENGTQNLISGKKVRNFAGSRVESGHIGIFNHAGKPKVLIEPGNYWNMRRLTRKFVGSFSLSSQIDVLGLTGAMCGQGKGYNL